MKYPRWAHEDKTLEQLEAPELDRYGAWAPTQYDTKGKYFHDAPDDYLELRVAMVRVYDTDDVARANFYELESVLSKLTENDDEGKDGPDWRVEHFGHWATHFDVLLVRKGTVCEDVARRALAYIVNYYPVLNEDRLESDDEHYEEDPEGEDGDEDEEGDE